MKVCLLQENKNFDFRNELPPHHEDLIQDLELSTLLSAMALGDKFLFDISRRVILASLTDPAAICYRQRVLADCIAQPEIIREMYAIAVAALQDKRGLWGYSSQYPASILSAAVRQPEALIGRLRDLRRIADSHAEKFRSEGMTTLFHGLQHDLDDDYFQELSHHLRQLRFRDGYLMSAELDRDNSGINYVLRSGEARRSWKERVGMAPRTSFSFTLPARDEAGAQALSDMTSRAINVVANVAAQSADHVTGYFTMLCAELAFYVSCLNLSDQLTARSQPMTFPLPSARLPWHLSCSGLCDASLALRLEGRAVGNDVDASGKSLVIITGANSGGKSTFLRSVGVAQLMMQCGMFVTAGSFQSSVCAGVFTHFIREEDPSMNSGRLDEELSRMSRIVDQISPRCLMLFNESFAATNEREGSEIGRQVVRALLEAQIRVFFVTHQYDFAESFHRQRADSTLFLRAERQSDGRRNFKLAAAAPLPTSYGEDIYYRIGGWMGERDLHRAHATSGSGSREQR
ncbi:MAG: MutS-related protein [Streptosporangiaceae bacterium]